jgi:integrase/recombinase XerD
VTRKGGDRVALVLPPATTAALDAYLATRVATPAMTTAVTAADRVAGRPPVASGNVVSADVATPLLATSTSGRLDQAALWHLVRRLARAAGIEHWAALSPRSLRHTAITLALDAGASLRDVQDFAGHRDPRTTRRYDRSRHSLDRNAAYTLAAYLA